MHKFIDNKSRYRRLHLINGITQQMINGENFLHPFILRLGCGQFLLCLEHIALRSYARNIHVLSRIHGTPGGKHLLGSIFLLFLIVGHFPATDYGQNLTFLHIISRFRMDFRHRPPEYGIHPCHLFLVESNTTVQGKFHRDLLYTYSINGHYLFQTVCQEDPPIGRVCLFSRCRTVTKKRKK